MTRGRGRRASARGTSSGTWGTAAAWARCTRGREAWRRCRSLIHHLGNGDAPHGLNQFVLQPVDRRFHALHIFDNVLSSQAVEVAEVGPVGAYLLAANLDWIGGLQDRKSVV